MFPANLGKETLYLWGAIVPQGNHPPPFPGLQHPALSLTGMTEPLLNANLVGCTAVCLSRCLIFLSQQRSWKCWQTFPLTSVKALLSFRGNICSLQLCNLLPPGCWRLLSSPVNPGWQTWFWGLKDAFFCCCCISKVLGSCPHLLLIPLWVLSVSETKLFGFCIGLPCWLSSSPFLQQRKTRCPQLNEVCYWACLQWKVMQRQWYQQ